MHTLIINGSPRKDGSTARLCEHFARGLTDAAGTVSTVFLGDVQIGYCRGCDACCDVGECANDDGMGDLARQILACDILVLASPSYWGDVTGQMKTFIDRSRPLCELVRGEYIGKGKLGASIAVRAGDGRDENLHLIQCFEHYFGHLGIEPAVHLTVEGVYAPQDLDDAYIESAYNLGRVLGEGRDDSSESVQE